MKTEVQVRVKVYDFVGMKKKISEMAEFENEEHKIDYYFERKSKSERTELRLRKIKNKNGISLKIYHLNGIERNKEYILNMDNASDCIDFLETLGMKVVAMKHKKSYFYKYKDITIQLASIKELGYFLEIEKKCDKKDEKEAEKEILELSRKLGISNDQTEKKSYLQLLLEKNMKKENN